MRPDRFLIPVIVLSLLVTVFSVSAQETGDTEPSAAGAEFGLGLTLGVETFDSDSGEPETYQTLALMPDIAIGNFGLGLELVLHYRFVSPESNDGSSFDVREEDWVPQTSEGETILDLYLPKITYVRYGYKGDMIYGKLGQIDDAALGTGFIVNKYSNTLFQPDEKIIGLNFDLDGQLFGFPYAGIETFAGNLAHFDVFGARVYSRPLLWLDLPIIKNLEWGITGAFDIDPDYRTEYFNPAISGGQDASVIAVFGSDLILPLLNFDIASLALFTDFAFQGSNSGSMVGFGGRLVSIIPYVFQIRFLGENFIPSYFDSTYDIYRGLKYAAVKSDTLAIPASTSWLATTGVSLFDDRLSFTATVDGPFAPIPTSREENTNYIEYPHLSALLRVEEGFIPKFSFNAAYDKKFITSFSDLVDLEDGMINIAVNYNAGAAVITLSYDLIYSPDDVTAVTDWNDFDVNSSLSCTLAIF